MDQWLKIVDDFFDPPESAVPQPSSAAKELESVQAVTAAATVNEP